MRMIAALYILLSACSKDSAVVNTMPATHADSLAIIMNNWTLIQDSLNDYHNTFHDSINTIGKQGDTWNFKAGNIVEINEMNYLQVSGSYQFTNDSKLEVPINLQPATIMVLNADHLVFYWNEPDNGTAHAFYRKIILKR